jgi:hypothetical protein
LFILFFVYLSLCLSIVYYLFIIFYFTYTFIFILPMLLYLFYLYFYIYFSYTFSFETKILNTPKLPPQLSPLFHHYFLPLLPFPSLQNIGGVTVFLRVPHTRLPPPWGNTRAHSHLRTHTYGV